MVTSAGLVLAGTVINESWIRWSSTSVQAASTASSAVVYVGPLPFMMLTRWPSGVVVPLAFWRSLAESWRRMSNTPR